MLDRQINLYSVDTGHFYSRHEKYLHDKYCRFRREQKELSSRLPDPSGQLKELISHKRNKAKQAKKQLLELLSHKAAQNEISGGKDHIRQLCSDFFNDNNIISVFDSSLTRAIGAEPDELIDDLIVVQIYYFDIFKDLLFYGFLYNGEQYQYFTSSAGQIRTKKAVFIKTSTWKRIEKTLMCGLTIDRINIKGGINANKYLAYLALANSATDIWEEFDIDRSIVIDDFETQVYGTFDFIDDSDYSVTRKNGAIPITHTDGAGMVLPSLMQRNSMFRAPWIKGLLGVFDFRQFLLEHNCSPVISDIYGKRHNIIEEDIRIIFTKSQFKMWKYYDSWEEYKQYFKKNNCSAGRCSPEEERIKNTRINYQMLQTLTDITEEDIRLLTQKSAQKITDICSSPEAMMHALGVTPYNTNPTPFQRAVKCYPALLSDTYVKDQLREIKDSLVKKYRSGKLEIMGKYTFLLPDFYAACEYWFANKKQPDGLLADREVFCRLFRSQEKLDCLRSPHLYREHAIRFNTACQTYGQDRTEQLQKWFLTDALYTSTHDLISKILQFDVDGDKSLVAADPALIAIAEKNMEGIVPLYYNMRKAKARPLTPETIYQGLHAAFTGAPIGTDSNEISKIWNLDIFRNGSDADKEEALKCIQWLCMENNFHIDYAKTLYKPERPPQVGAVIRKYTNAKLPAFFSFAKDKDLTQVEPRSQSLVNRLYEFIPDKAVRTRSLKLDKPDYRKLMQTPSVTCPKEVASLYDMLNRQYRYMFYQKDERDNNGNYVSHMIRSRFAQLGYSDPVIADMLVSYLYGQEKRSKQLLWFCYGSYLADNLERHVAPPMKKTIRCRDCGEWFEVPRLSRSCRCTVCQQMENRRRKRLYWQKNHPLETS